MSRGREHEGSWLGQWTQRPVHLARVLSFNLIDGELDAHSPGNVPSTEDRLSVWPLLYPPGLTMFVMAPWVLSHPAHSFGYTFHNISYFLARNYVIHVRFVNAAMIHVCGSVVIILVLFAFQFQTLLARFDSFWLGSCFIEWSSEVGQSVLGDKQQLYCIIHSTTDLLMCIYFVFNCRTCI